jgi:RNA polymerase sigma-70 factor (ECF subfamily)
MSSNLSDDTSGPGAANRAVPFATTHWSTVLAAGDGASPQAQTALEKLCRIYWFPLYAFARRQGHDAEAAQDLTQGFFVHVLERDLFARATPERGKFRSFLLGAFKRFIRDQDRAQHAQQRGGQVEFVALDSEQAEERLATQPFAGDDPDTTFDREWALTVLNEAMNLLEQECYREGKGAQFEILHPWLQGDRPESPQAELAARFDLSVGALKVAIHRMRRRYGELLRAVVAHTVPDPADVDEELRHLVRLLGQ